MQVGLLKTVKSLKSKINWYNVKVNCWSLKVTVILFIYLFAIHSTCTYEYIRFHKQIVQYGRLSENRQYTYTSPETIGKKMKLW